MTAPRISVIIPVYNVEDYVERCIDSVLGQNCTDVEIILVDDGSSDRSGSICDEYARREPRIKVIHQLNGGPGEARNAGLMEATGEYISFIDGDDWIEKDTYGQLVKIIEQYSPDMIRFGFKKIQSGKVVAERTMFYPKGYYQGEALNPQRLDIISNEYILDYKKNRVLSAWSNFYRRELIEKNKIIFITEREILNEDYLFVLQTFMAAESVYISDKNFYCYDTRRGSITMSYRSNMLERKQKLFELYCQSVDMQNQDVCIRLKNFYIDCIYACVVNECLGYRGLCDSMTTIRKLLKDERLQKYLRDNRELVNSVKTKILCFLMRHCMAMCMYGSYRVLQSVKKMMSK